MQDLWPNDIAQQENIRTPVSILREQATLLGQKTKNIVTAEVVPIENRAAYVPGMLTHELLAELNQSPDDFKFRFYLVAPALQNYRYRLFDIAHAIELYPLRMYLDKEISSELFGKETQVFTIGSEDNFLNVLQKVFAAPKTRRVISSILAQSITEDISLNQQ